MFCLWWINFHSDLDVPWLWLAYGSGWLVHLNLVSCLIKLSNGVFMLELHCTHQVECNSTPYSRQLLLDHMINNISLLTVGQLLLI